MMTKKQLAAFLIGSLVSLFLKFLLYDNISFGQSVIMTVPVLILGLLLYLFYLLLMTLGGDKKPK